MHGSAQLSRFARTLAGLRRRWARRLLLAGVAAAAGGGCSRQHFRDRADKDVAGVISQKNVFPDWKVENWHVYPDPRSRFADPNCPDHPPYPPDDPAAYILSPNPQRPHKKWGTGRFEGTGYLQLVSNWDQSNRAADGPDGDRPPDVPKPQTPTAARAAEDATGAVTGGVAGYIFALKSDEKPYRLRLEQAVELGLFNSREFQDRREDLYLTALPVTTERFSFAAQALATETVVREALGRERPGGPANRWNIGTTAAVSKLFPTGAQLLIRLANQITLDLTSGRPDLSVSNFSLSFVQPLLRGGGYAVTLEALTQAERTLLYAIRSYARFRKVFFVAIAGQGDYTNNPYGLQGLAPNLGRGIGNNLTAPTAGYLPVVLRAANLANERKNIAALEALVRLYQNLKEGGVVSDLQSVRVELQLLQSQARLLDNTRLYLDQLDTFKLQLGVPTNLALELDDAPVRPMRQQVRKFETVYDDLSKLVAAATTSFAAGETATAARERWRKLLLESDLAKGMPFVNDYPARADELAKLSADALAGRVRDLSAQRQQLLDARAARQLAGKAETPAEEQAIDTIEARIDEARFEQALRAYEAVPWLRSPADRRAIEQGISYRRVVDAGLLIALQARNQRLDKVRATWPELPPVAVDGADVLKVPLDEGYAKVAQTALLSRLDLMNARAQVVDAYRQIAVRANALRGTFDVQYDYQTNTPGADNIGLALGGSRYRNAVSINAEPPLVRRVERNNYRAALISFQRQRRTLMAFEDNILNDVRADLRQLRALYETYNVQKRAVELAYAQVDNARNVLVAPPDPADRGTASSAANLTEQLLQAQNQLLQSQNALYTAWVNYQTTRLNLYLDLESLPLDSRGLWTDEPSPRPADPKLEPGPAAAAS